MMNHSTAPSTSAPRTPGASSRARRTTITAYLFLAPALIGFLVFYLVPMVKGLQISLTDWDLITAPEFVGFGNYAKLLADENFGHSLAITAVYVIVNITTQTAAGLAIAVLMQRISHSTLIRSLLLVPWLVPNVTIAVITLFILDPNVGLLNHGLELLGTEPIAFYGDPDIAILTVALVNSWRNMGYTALLIFAGMQTIPQMVYEAAALDGASAARTFFRITLPLTRPILVMVVIVSMIGSFQIFDTVAVATKGGPIGSTRVIYFYIYQKAFEQGQMGYAAAMSVVLLLIILLMTLVQLRFSRAEQSDLG
ncbi:carbohydrate ABC transporter permease [Schaalia hyovaginalis]|uniref:Multiple sugar transport system permease protein n=2 Tax=Schaalia hyovaginalis TaxID=29316 RepID=A0A923E2P0_9ACTO|nr:sugar ABC transporter permease [Schaalia hyovaginalis]MBB6333783.1 multiple sugar transport system permease protein [Schaalia hyovaginalis]MDY2668967.1 sugar ABC transporter permease [Schaalia hyovaginalis]MDY3665160.1 sugar ABC transporter permease [Schaalia hyovaginalis]